ncbi:hypothetical protein GCM10007424_23610 [Flavobacterium suaedae]|uniref:Bacterial Pleckstrin homology domain-containing protein n=1 Tax=Flavobacterium suaedae TaxID=1767027 RepID=A0ABQ1K3K0_9FLAO|nr:PH domain-containing protein [Flavobacterium suaedae]GGB82863.1 hypothetical protein GCM10007424_23610 [Flavobacterium suaedae]
MGFLDKQIKKIEEKCKEELKTLLLEDETLEKFYLVKEDYCAITNLRLIFVDNSFTSSKKATTGVPFNKISFVSLKKGGTFTISKDVIVHVGNKDIEIDLYDTNQAIEIFKIISKKIL